MAEHFIIGAFVGGAMAGTTLAAFVLFLGFSAPIEHFQIRSEPEKPLLTKNYIPLDGSFGYSSDYDALYERFFKLAMPKNPAQERYVIRKAKAAERLILYTSGSFRDLKYFNNWNDGSRAFIQHGYRLAHMTEAFLLDKPGNRYYNNLEIKRKIILGFRYIIDIAPSNRDWNWWGLQIGTPKSLWEAFILASSFIDKDLLSRGLRRYWIATKVWDPEDRSGCMAGSNLANRGFLSLVQTYLDGESQFNARYAEVMKMVYRELIDKEPYGGNGISHDNCMHQHNIPAGNRGPYFNTHIRRLIYNGQYGGDYMKHISQLILLFQNLTKYEFSEQSVEEFTKAFLDCHVMFLRGRTFEPSVCGRSITGNARVTYWTAFNSVYQVASVLLPVGHRVKEIQDVLDRYHNKGPNPKNALVKNRSLFASDMMVHQRLGFMATVRMFSSRTTRPETWIGRRTMNENGYYLGDGMTTILKDGDEFGVRGNELFQHYDWAKIPGATIEYTEQVPQEGMELDPNNFPHHISEADFVGSTSDGVYGVAAMDYNRPTVNITLKKSWFFFDHELVCLGSDIETRPGKKDNQSVFTTLNQIIQDGVITAFDTTKGQIEIQNGEVYLPNPIWVHHDDTAYVFLSNDTRHVYIQGENRSKPDVDTNKVISNRVFSTWIDHGRMPHNLQYAYVISPNVTVAHIDEYIQSNPIERVQQDSNIHAVFHTSLNITGLVFFAPGNVSTPNGYVISADNPSIVMLRETEVNIFITCSNPQNERLVLKIKLGKNIRGPSVRNLRGLGMTEVTFDLPSGRLAGSSITKSFRWQEAGFSNHIPQYVPESER